MMRRLRLIKALTMVEPLPLFGSLVRLLQVEHQNTAHLQTGESH
jgi:hypothetical protein